MPTFNEFRIDMENRPLTVEKWNGLVNEIERYKTNIFLDDSNGNVGLGVNTPRAPLHIVDARQPLGGVSSAENGLMLGSNGASSYKWIQSYGGPLSINSMGQNVGIATATPREVFQIGDRWTFHSGGAKFIGYNAYWDGNVQRRLVKGHASEIRFDADGDLVFKMGAGENEAEEVINFPSLGGVIFKRDGKVGIGTFSPSKKLDVNGELSVKGKLNFKTTGGRTRVEINSFDGGNGTTSGLYLSLYPQGNSDALMGIFRGTNTSGKSQLNIFRGNGTNQSNAVIAGNGTNTFFARYSGDVGIGTASPQAKLHVNGTVRSTDILIDTKPIQIVSYKSGFTFSSTLPHLYYFYKDTNKSVDEWTAAIAGFNTGSADVQESGGGRFMAVQMVIHNNQWRILAYLKTHNDSENWKVDVMFVSKKISSAIGF